MNSQDPSKQSLNYYSKKYLSEVSTKKKPKISPIRFSNYNRNLLPKTLHQKPPLKKQKSFEISYAIQVKYVDPPHYQNDFDQSMAQFFFDESRPSVMQGSKSKQFDTNLPLSCQTTQNTPLKVTLPDKINEDSSEQEGQQINHQQPQIYLEMKQVLSQPQIKCPMSPPLEPLPRRKTQCIPQFKQLQKEPIKPKPAMNRLLKRFTKYSKNQTEQKELNFDILGKIVQKVEQDDMS